MGSQSTDRADKNGSGWRGLRRKLAAGVTALAAIVVGAGAFPSHASRIDAAAVPSFAALASIELPPLEQTAATPWSRLGAERRAVTRLAASSGQSPERGGAKVPVYVARAEAALTAIEHRALVERLGRD